MMTVLFLEDSESDKEQGQGCNIQDNSGDCSSDHVY